MRHNLEGEIYGRFGEVIGRIPPSKIEGGVHIYHAQKWLEEGGSILAYFLPHTCTHDPEVVIEQLIRPELLLYAHGEFVCPASVKLFGNIPEVTGLEKEKKGAHVYALRAGFEAAPVFQPYLVNQLKDEHPHLVPIARDTNERALLTMLHTLKQRRSVVMIAPEGTRKDDGMVHRADPHMSILLRNMTTPVAALPIVLEGVHKIQPLDSEGWHNLRPNTPITIRVGSLLTAEQARNIAKQHEWNNPTELAKKNGWDESYSHKFTAADAIMLHAVRTLQLEQYRTGVNPAGVYVAENIIEKTNI